MEDNGSLTVGYGELSTEDPANDTGGGERGRNEELAKIEIAVLALIFCLAILGNSVVLIVLKMKKTKLNRMQLLIVYLSLTDLSVGIFNILPQLIKDVTFYFYSNDFMCKLVFYMQIVVLYASSYVLIVTAVDRYISICLPLKSQKMTNKVVHIMTGIAWLLAFVFSIPAWIIFKLVPQNNGKSICKSTLEREIAKGYMTWVFMAVYLIPLLLLILLYGKICYAVWVSMTSRENSMLRTIGNRSRKTTYQIPSRRDENQGKVSHCNAERGLTRSPQYYIRRVSKSKVKTIKLTLAVVICYLVCFAPFFVSQMWSVYSTNAPTEEAFFVVVALLANLNSCTNPWIYLSFSGKVWCRQQKRSFNRSWTQTTTTHVESERRYRISIPMGVSSPRKLHSDENSASNVTSSSF